MTIFYIALGLIVVVGIAVLVTKLISTHQQEELLPYRLKKFFFTKSEQEFLRILNEVIDRQRYIVFPKVRLVDFVDVIADKEDYQKWWNKIRSKHVDFLIWDVLESRIALAIEVDGKSHSSERMITSDKFKDELYTRIEVELHRIKVGSDFKSEAEKLVQTL